MRRRHLIVIVAALSSVLGIALVLSTDQIGARALPKKLGDKAYWQMIVDFSEPGGTFRSDNFVSNETTYQEPISELKKRSSPNGAYLGVGPDQNFTYITALRPRIAFIIDIRRQNLIEHLFYKAIVELSNDRADFLSYLFARPRPKELQSSVPLAALFEAYNPIAAGEEQFQANLKAIENHLVKRHGFPLTPEDLRSLEYVYRAFFLEGPDLRYSFPRRRTPWFPSYAELMKATDQTGLNHSYIATEQNFRALREFQMNNLLVPIVGDFGGDKAIREVGRYLREHGATVDYFYTSNVEQYLFQNDAWRHYYSSVATLPFSERSVFVRAFFDRGFMYPPGIVTPDLHSVPLIDPISGFVKAFEAGRVKSYEDVIARSR